MNLKTLQPIILFNLIQTLTMIKLGNMNKIRSIFHKYQSAHHIQVFSKTQPQTTMQPTLLYIFRKTNTEPLSNDWIYKTPNKMNNHKAVNQSPISQIQHKGRKIYQNLITNLMLLLRLFS